MLPPNITYLCAYSAHLAGSRAKRSSPTGCHRDTCCPTGFFCVGQSTCCQLGQVPCGEGSSNCYYHAFRHGRALIPKPSLPSWLCADLHLACCPQGLICCGKACCTAGFACVGDGDCQSTTPTTTSTTRTPKGTSTNTSSAPTGPANSSNNASVIGPAIGGTIGGIILLLGGISVIYFWRHKEDKPDTTPTQPMSTPATDYNQPQVSPYQHSVFAAAAPPSSATYGTSGAPDPNNSAGSPNNTGRSTYGGTTAEATV